MNCPRCQKSLKPIQYESVEIDSCPGNCGVWLDTGEIQKITQQVEENFSAQESVAAFQKAAAGIPPAEKDSVEKCPHCSEAMNPMNYNYSSGVILDVCPHGHGIWFDAKELEHVQIHFEHWNRKLKESHSSWTELAKKAEDGARKTMFENATAANRNLGPMSRAVDAIFRLLKI